jgi:hypothetical protein
MKHTFESVRKFVEDSGFILLSDYIRSDKNISIKCLKCGFIWDVQFGHFYNRNNKCKNCSFFNKFTLEEAKNICHGKHLILLDNFYKDSKTSMNVQCEKCHYVWKNTICNIQKNLEYCPKCKIEEQRHTYEYVKEYCKNVGINLLSREYHRTHEKLQLECIKCKYVWFTGFSRIVSGNRCPDCANRFVHEKQKHSYEYVKEYCKNVGINLLSTTYSNANEKIKLQCIVCGNVWKCDFHHLKGNKNEIKCSKCFSTGEQKKLSLIVKEIFPNFIHEFNVFKFNWLKSPITNKKLQIDIYIKDPNSNFSLAIEYDGKQHFESISFFGGIPRLEETKRNDNIKNNLISQHKEDVKYFIRFNYKEKLTKEYVLQKLVSCGIVL